MASLQDQADSAFQDDFGEASSQQQLAAEQADNDLKLPQYADDDGESAGDFPSLQYDGKGHKKSTADMDFADDETTKGVFDDEQAEEPQRRPVSERDDGIDIHGPKQTAEATAQPDVREGLSDSAIHRARQYGLDEGQIRASYKTDAELQDALVQYDQQMMQQLQQWRQMQQYQPQQPQQPRPPQQQAQPMQPQQPQQPMTPQQQQQLIEEYKVQHPELYDETLLEDMQGMSKHVSQMIQRQQQQIQGLQSYIEHQHLAQRQAAERDFVEAFDDSIRELGKDWADVFGAGHYSQMNQQSAEMFNRTRLMRALLDLSQAHAQQGRNVDAQQLLQSALRITFPDKNRGSGTPAQKAPETQTAPEQPRDDKGRFTTYTARPTGRSGHKQVNPRDNLLRQWDKVMGAIGYEDDEGEL